MSGKALFNIKINNNIYLLNIKKNQKVSRYIIKGKVLWRYNERVMNTINDNYWRENNEKEKYFSVSNGNPYDAGYGRLR